MMLTKESRKRNMNEHDLIFESHFCWIKNLSALIGAQISKHGHRLSICDRCLIHFTTEEKLVKHKVVCANMNKCAIEMPKEENKYETFKNYKNQLKTPFIIYADTEAILKPHETPIFSKNCSTKAHQHPQVHSIGYYFYCENDESQSRYASYRGRDCIDWFMNELTKIATEAYNILEDKKPMRVLSNVEERLFQEISFCHICKKDFETNSDDNRVRDHCHISGEFRGAAHQSCNLKYQISRTIPVVFHNLSGYDSHLLIRGLGDNKKKPGELTVIPHNSENYISIFKTMRCVGRPERSHKNANAINLNSLIHCDLCRHL